MALSQQNINGLTKLLESIQDNEMRTIDYNISKYGSTIENIITESLKHHLVKLLGGDEQADKFLNQPYSYYSISLDTECEDSVADVISSDIMTSIIFAVGSDHRLK